MLSPTAASVKPSATLIASSRCGSRGAGGGGCWAAMATPASTRNDPMTGMRRHGSLHVTGTITVHSRTMRGCATWHLDRRCSASRSLSPAIACRRRAAQPPRLNSPRSSTNTSINSRDAIPRLPPATAFTRTTGSSRTSRRRRLPRRSTGCVGFDAGSTRWIRLPLTPDERVDRRILQGVIDGWLLDLDTIRTWTRNPMIYASAISDGVHNLMTMESSPAASRARQATTKLAACRACSPSARENLRQPAAGVRDARRS